MSDQDRHDDHARGAVEEPTEGAEPGGEAGSSEGVRDLVRRAMAAREPAPGDVLRGVQRRIRERSRGKFYDDGWSTARHPPVYTFLVTSVVMLFVLAAVYWMLVPLFGDPIPVDNVPAPVRVVPPPR